MKIPFQSISFRSIFINILAFSLISFIFSLSTSIAFAGSTIKFNDVQPNPQYQNSGGTWQQMTFVTCVTSSNGAFLYWSKPGDTSWTPVDWDTTGSVQNWVGGVTIADTDANSCAAGGGTGVDTTIWMPKNSDGGNPSPNIVYTFALFPRTDTSVTNGGDKPKTGNTPSADVTVWFYPPPSIVLAAPADNSTMPYIDNGFSISWTPSNTDSFSYYNVRVRDDGLTCGSGGLLHQYNGLGKNTTWQTLKTAASPPASATTNAERILYPGRCYTWWVDGITPTGATIPSSGRTFRIAKYETRVRSFGVTTLTPISGSTITFSGYLEYKNIGGTWDPLPTQTIVLRDASGAAVGGEGNTAVTQSTTDPKPGYFSINVTVTGNIYAVRPVYNGDASYSNYNGSDFAVNIYPVTCPSAPALNSPPSNTTQATPLTVSWTGSNTYDSFIVKVRDNSFPDPKPVYEKSVINTTTSVILNLASGTINQADVDAGNILYIGNNYTWSVEGVKSGCGTNNKTPSGERTFTVGYNTQISNFSISDDNPVSGQIVHFTGNLQYVNSGGGLTNMNQVNMRISGPSCNITFQTNQYGDVDATCTITSGGTYQLIFDGSPGYSSTSASRSITINSDNLIYPEPYSDPRTMLNNSTPEQPDSKNDIECNTRYFSQNILIDNVQYRDSVECKWNSNNGHYLERNSTAHEGTTLNSYAGQVITIPSNINQITKIVFNSIWVGHLRADIQEGMNAVVRVYRAATAGGDPVRGVLINSLPITVPYSGSTAAPPIQANFSSPVNVTPGERIYFELYSTDNLLTRTSASYTGLVLKIPIANSVYNQAKDSYAKGYAVWAAGGVGSGPYDLDAHNFTSDLAYVKVFGKLASTTTTSNATCISHTIPTSFTTNEVKAVTVTVKNTGTTTWTATGINPFRLGSSNPRENQVWRDSSGNPLTRIPLPNNAPVDPNGTVTFNFSMKAPATPATYSGQWEMLQELVGWLEGVCGPTSIQVIEQTTDLPVLIRGRLTDQSGTGLGGKTVYLDIPGSTITLTTAPDGYFSNNTDVYLNDTYSIRAPSAAELGFGSRTPSSNYSNQVAGGAPDCRTTCNFQYTPVPDKPDLRVEPLTPLTVVVNLGATISGTIKNYGTPTSTTSTTTLKIDINKDSDFLDAIDRTFNKTTKVLASNESATETWTCVGMNCSNTWTPTATGNYPYQICADNPSTISESNEDNNCQVDTITVVPGVSPCTITTLTPTNITASGSTFGATFVGRIETDGGATIAARGFEYRVSGSSSTLTLPDFASGPYTVGQYQVIKNADATHLTPSTGYQVRAYASNGDICYGNWVSFSTPSSSSPTVSLNGEKQDLFGNWLTPSNYISIVQGTPVRLVWSTVNSPERCTASSLTASGTVDLVWNGLICSNTTTCSAGGTNQSITPTVGNNTYSIFCSKTGFSNTPTINVTINVTPYPPDLSILSGSLDKVTGTYSPGSVVTFRGTIINSVGGANVTAPFSNRFDIDENNSTFNTADRSLNTANITSLAAGASQQVTSSIGWTVPTCTSPPCNHVLRLYTDTTNSIAESNENNNFLDLPITIDSSATTTGQPWIQTSGGSIHTNKAISVPSATPRTEP